MAFDATTERDAVVNVAGESVPVEAGVRQLVALNRLFLSDSNVRKVRNPESVPALAATIEAEGLLYPLCVVPERRKGVKGETFGVVAGGRRLAALQWLVEQGRMPKDAPIECLCFDAGRGVGLSLTENSQQEAMHPADQLDAFRALVQQGKTVGQIAGAFGVSVLTVERRLKLARLAPAFLALYREGKIEPQQMQALAMVEDHEQQVRVWESLPSYSRSGYNIRAHLTESDVSADSRLGRFVGIEAYRAAGGIVREDLFADEGEASLQDGELVHRLALEQLEGRAQALRAVGWKWVEAHGEFAHADRSRFAQLRCETRVPTKAEKAALDAMAVDVERVRGRLGELEELRYESDGSDEEWTPEQEAEYTALDEQADNLQDQLDAMRDALREWTPEQKAVAGAVVTIDHAGHLSIIEGLVRPEDRKQMASQAKDAGQPMAYTSQPKEQKERAEFSATLCQSLTAHRTAAVAAALTQNPKVALAALVHTLVTSQRERWLSSPLDVRFENHNADVTRAAAEYDQTPAARTLEQADALLDHVPGDSARLFDHLQAMEVAGLLDLLAQSVGNAYSVKSPDAARAASHGFDPAARIERALGIDMADWWAPTAERFLSHVSKAKMIEAVTEACGAEAARPIEKLKKADAIAASAALLEGKGWLPSTLRPYSAAEVDTGVDDA